MLPAIVKSIRRDAISCLAPLGAAFISVPVARRVLSA